MEGFLIWTFGGLLLDIIDIIFNSIDCIIYYIDYILL